MNNNGKLYNRKNNKYSKIKTTSQDIRRLINDLTKFNKHILNNYGRSEYRSRIIESNQGIKDMLIKQEKRNIIKNEKLKEKDIYNLEPIEIIEISSSEELVDWPF